MQEIARPRVQFVINRYECNLRIFKITNTYYSRIVREDRVIFFIVHSTKLRRFHRNVIGTPTEYNLGLIQCTALDQSKLINFVECTISFKIYYFNGNPIARQQAVSRFLENCGGKRKAKVGA